MTDTYLASLIPESNTLSLAFARRASALREMVYAPDSGFVGAFRDADGEAEWARRAARYMRDDFLHNTPGRRKRLGDVLSTFRGDGAGECSVVFRHALDAWVAGGRQGVEPYSTSQVYGSCIDAAASEHKTAIVAYRAARMPEVHEVYKYACAWYDYAERAYCSDGWNNSGSAAVALRLGLAFRIAYNLGGKSVDFTDDDKNEQIVARTWCRSGVPEWLSGYTSQFHKFEDGAITEFEGGVKELRAVFAEGGVVSTSGRFTSGGSKPFTNGSVGPHGQSGVGGDDADDCRQFLRDVVNVAPRENDFPVVMNQTWGPGWKGECADKYWPWGTDSDGKVWTLADLKAANLSPERLAELIEDARGKWGWGWKPQGAWVVWASTLLDRLSVDYAWLPRVKGFPSGEPTPEPDKPAPPISGELYLEQVGDKLPIRGEVECNGFRYIAIPAATKGRYRLVPKQVV